MISARIKRHVALSIVLALLMVCCFLWPLHQLCKWKIMSQGQVNMQLQACLFVMMLQR